MDGFTATALIRKLETSAAAARRVPVLALTAFATKADKEKCLQAGMDDYLTKPVRSDALVKAIARAARAAQRTAAGELRPVGESPSALQLQAGYHGRLQTITQALHRAASQQQLRVVASKPSR